MYTPKLLIWNEKMTTGNDEIDAQHKYLIEFFNDLGTSIRKGDKPDDITKVLKVMKYYSEWHFGKEEDCMFRYRCPAAEKNQKAHEVFIRRLTDYEKEYETSGKSNELAIKIHQDLSDWIVKHIMAVDTQLYPYLHPKPKEEQP